MTATSKEELRQRLAAIANGPWAQGLVTTRQKLAPVDPLQLPKSSDSLALDEIELSIPNRRRNNRLAAVLRPHFESEEGITNPTEIETRDALDRALTVP